MGSSLWRLLLEGEVAAFSGMMLGFWKGCWGTLPGVFRPFEYGYGLLCGIDA